MATRNFALTYKRNYSQFKTDNNSDSYLNISEEIYDEESAGFAIGNIFGPFVVGIHQEQV